jgi:Holliday junction DNA helicase RuvA
MLLLEVQGVGYELDAPMSTFYGLPEAGAEVMLYTHLAIREDAHNLYGFISELERSLFRSLIKVNGVGAKLALAILSGLTVEEFQKAVEYQDTGRLVKVPGIGKKTAERLIIELRDRVTDLAVRSLNGANGGVLVIPESPVDDAVAALVALGFRPQDAALLVRKVEGSAQTSQELIRLALQASSKA